MVGFVLDGQFCIRRRNFIALLGSATVAWPLVARAIARRYRERITSSALFADKLKRGRAVVKLDGDFAKVIKRDDYHIFLTPRGDCHGLYVRSQGRLSFEVCELAGGRSNVAFSYRIVGRRKDIKGYRRFAKIDTRLPLPLPRARPTRAKTSSPTPAELRAFVARLQKEARGAHGKARAQRQTICEVEPKRQTLTPAANS